MKAFRRLCGPVALELDGKLAFNDAARVCVNQSTVRHFRLRISCTVAMAGLLLAQLVLRWLVVLLAASIAAQAQKQRKREACAPLIQRSRLSELARLCPPPHPRSIGGERIGPSDLSRFLRVRGWNVEKTAPVVLDDYKWRCALRPRALRQERDTPAAARQGAWRQPRDAFGRPVRTADGLPVTTVSTGAWRPHAYGRAQNIKHVAFCMEDMVKKMEDDVEGAAMLLDMAGFKASLLFPYVKDGVDTCQRHYPCRLGAIVAFNLPPYFPTIWQVVQPWLNADIREKISFAPRAVQNHAQALAWYDSTKARRGATHKLRLPPALRWLKSGAVREP